MKGGNKHLPYDKVERAARMYRTTGEMAEALGVHPKSIATICKRLGVPTPYQRTNKLNTSNPVTSRD